MHWSRPDSNRRPSGCKPDALPTELRPLNPAGVSQIRVFGHAFNQPCCDTQLSPSSRPQATSLPDVQRSLHQGAERPRPHRTPTDLLRTWNRLSSLSLTGWKAGPIDVPLRSLLRTARPRHRLSGERSLRSPQAGPHDQRCGDGLVGPPIDGKRSALDLRTELRTAAFARTHAHRPAEPIGQRAAIHEDTIGLRGVFSTLLRRHWLLLKNHAHVQGMQRALKCIGRQTNLALGGRAASTGSAGLVHQSLPT